MSTREQAIDVVLDDGFPPTAANVQAWIEEHTPASPPRVLYRWTFCRTAIDEEGFYDHDLDHRVTVTAPDYETAAFKALNLKVPFLDGCHACVVLDNVEEVES